MKLKAILVLGAMLSISIVGFVYATSSNQADEQQVAALKHTVSGLEQRVSKLEKRVDDLLKPKLERINGGAQ